MKPIVYFFGTLPGGFSSYPQDHTKKIFEAFVSKSKNTCQIVLHRKDNLLHYGYVRRMPDNNFLGICLCIDCIYNNVKHLFSVFDDIYASMIKKGDILKISSGKSICWATKYFASETVSLTEYTNQIIERIRISANNTQSLPPVDFSISINDCLDLSLENSSDQIIDATKRYTNLYIVKKESEIERVTGFIHVVETKDKEISILKQEIRGHKKRNAELSVQLTKVKIQQRNIIWLSVVGVIALFLGIVVWNKVLFPSEVTHYQTGEFVYYGPMKNNKPHGVGVAIYPFDDEDGRKYYIGNFVDGNRQDTAAILFYQDGDYFYGEMTGDEWKNGLLYKHTDGTYFKGTFEKNVPYNGEWFDHVKKYNSVNGQEDYSNQNRHMEKDVPKMLER